MHGGGGGLVRRSGESSLDLEAGPMPRRHAAGSSGTPAGSSGGDPHRLFSCASKGRSRPAFRIIHEPFVNRPMPFPRRGA